jgi:hypothetical protein
VRCSTACGAVYLGQNIRTWPPEANFRNGVAEIKNAYFHVSRRR